MGRGPRRSVLGKCVEGSGRLGSELGCGESVLWGGNVPRRDMYGDAAVQGRAPVWIADNRVTIEIIERKMLSTHDSVENLRLAFTFPERFQPGPTDL